MPAIKQFNIRPLYQQVADEFITRIVSRQWAPGQIIENESDIARSLGISIGTVRKAFDVLAEYALLERQQGRGTIVADLSSESMQSRFSNILDETGEKAVLSTEVENAELQKARPEVSTALGLTDKSTVLRFERNRKFKGRLVLKETVFIPCDASRKSMPQDKLRSLAEGGWAANGLATRKSERITPALASADDAAALGISQGAPVLHLERVIHSYENVALELCYSVCNLGDDLSYGVES
ncbi:GntR family transcriptional regulator [Aureimonas fodinaquatilis]|uniref:GntR family transcriptional regulator n=1 Tax=Aureimonas fodinaquatilis TaxID=2565783 RepID=A0A5B0E0G7_9HYPH|nr:GntR family transcriptional regulator [Aureimonas fodinaquatilis]KAA0972557.1 GntR family transcriptional regulator [Aureimonas fodinaquatilis]